MGKIELAGQNQVAAKPPKAKVTQPNIDPVKLANPCPESQIKIRIAKQGQINDRENRCQGKVTRRVLEAVQIKGKRISEKSAGRIQKQELITRRI